MKSDTVKAIFLDRDGVLNEDLGYTFKTTDMHLFADVPNALKKLKEKNFLLIVITNQSGVARGYFGLNDVTQFHETMQKKLKESGVHIDDFYVCPHFPDAENKEFAMACECRKPGTKNVEEAIHKYHISREQSFFIGDRDSDLACGKKAGLKTIFLNREKQPTSALADAECHDLHEAVSYILK